MRIESALLVTRVKVCKSVAGMEAYLIYLLRPNIQTTMHGMALSVSPACPSKREWSKIACSRKKRRHGSRCVSKYVINAIF